MKVGKYRRRMKWRIIKWIRRRKRQKGRNSNNNRRKRKINRWWNRNRK